MSTVIGLVLLVLLIIFIAQNQAIVPLQYFGWNGSVSLGLTLFISAVAGGLVIAVVAVARIIQLRSTAAAQRKKLNR
ncbi:lipopolysaccharide assembly LapA domain-containing protein [Glutamicibacter sp. NPDC087344]|uniref:LapA family protein n=1 Tax=Glutamicibacter sp. NPDC087344 TaxID=3363994 RepID=UPI00381C50DC